jgi:DNA polymerase-3 subunit beta
MIVTKEFVNELQFVAPFAETKTTIPILTYIALRSEKGRIYIAATDLEVAGVSSIAVSGNEQWAVCLPVGILLDRIKVGTEITTDAANIKITTSGRSNLFGESTKSFLSITGLGIESFPQIPVLAANTQLFGLRTAAPRILIAVSRKALTKFTLNAALLEIGSWGCKLVSTDNSQLSIVDLSCTSKLPVKVLIPSGALRHLDAWESAHFGFNNEALIFSRGCRSVVTQRLLGDFPDYKCIIPKDHLYKLALPVKTTIAALEKLIPARIVKATLTKGLLTLSTVDADAGQYAEHIPVEWSGGPWEAGYNVIYLRNMLSLCPSATVEWSFTSARKANTFAVPGWKYVLMPLKI